MSYKTLDQYPDLTALQMYSATKLYLTPDSTGARDNSVYVIGGENYASQHSIYEFTITVGSIYDIISTSYVDPDLRIYDEFGNTIAVNEEGDDPSDELLPDGGYYGTDSIFEIAPYSGTFYVDAGWIQGSYNTYYGLLIGETLDTVPVTPDTPVPGHTLTGTAGNDYLQGFGGNDILNGGAGTDTAIFSGTHASHTITQNATTFTVYSTTNGFDTLSDIERLQFTDKTIALDIGGNAGQAYRLYQAAFDRTPDNNGLKYWISVMDAGNSLETVASGFIVSNEFTGLYGSNPTNRELVSKLYNNVLHRTPDQGGYDYWVNLLDTGEINKAQTLVNFSESSENQVAVLGVIEYGIELF